MNRTKLLISFLIMLCLSTIALEQKTLFYMLSDNDYRFDVKNKLEKILSLKGNDDIKVKLDKYRSMFPDKDVFEDMYKERNTDFIDINSGDPSKLKKILNESVQILWIYSPGYLKNNRVNGFSEHFEPLFFDGSSKDFLDLSELEKIFDQRFSLIVVDHSLFSSIENIYALRNNFEYMIATQEIIPIKGLPVDAFLKSLKEKNINQSIDSIFKDIKEYYDAKKKGWWEVPVRYQLSLLSSQSLKRFALHFKFFTKLLQREYRENSEEILRARKMSVDFNGDYIDIHSFLRNIHNVRLSRALKEQADNLEHVLSKIVRRNYFQSPGNRVSGGLSVFFPVSGTLPTGYSESSFAKETGWSDFLLNVLKED